MPVTQRPTGVRTPSGDPEPPLQDADTGAHSKRKIFLVAQEDELGGPGDEMSFALPAAASPAAQQALLAGGREAARAGGHLLPNQAAALLAWDLAAALLAAAECALLSPLVPSACCVT